LFHLATISCARRFTTLKAAQGRRTPKASPDQCAAAGAKRLGLRMGFRFYRLKAFNAFVCGLAALRRIADFNRRACDESGR
jgi:hypothetical protein